MDKDNIFRSSAFHMDAGDVCHILVKDLVGGTIYVGLNTTDDDTEEDNSWWSYSSITDLLDFLWIGEVDGNYLVSAFDDRRIEVIGKDFFGNFIPGGSISTFRLQADADFIADDTDHLWFTGGVQNDVTVTNLISGDYRTLVRYSNVSPFDISAIALLKSTVVLTATIINQLSTVMELWLFWSGTYNDYGFVKDNRLIP